MTADLAAKFDELLRQDCEECRRIKCPQGPFEQMLKRGVEASIRVIMLPDYPVPGGFQRLWERSLKEPDVMKLTAEARALEWPWCELFEKRPDVLRNAQRRLRASGRPDLTTAAVLTARLPFAVRFFAPSHCLTRRLSPPPRSHRRGIQ